MRPVLQWVFGFGTIQKRGVSGFLSSEAKQWLRREIGKFDAKEKLERAMTPPTSWYVAPEFYHLDKGAILRSNFCAVESQHRVADKNGFLATNFAGEQYLFTKPEKSENVKGFYNICRHHGVTLEWKECGKAANFACPYHGWTFDNEGRLIKTTKMKGIECFQAKNYGLEGVNVYPQWPIIFAKPAKHPTTPGSSVDNMKLLTKNINMLHKQLFFRPSQFVTPDNYQHIIRKVYDVKCNWKVYVDNFLDDSYHFNFIHAKTQGTICDLGNFSTEIYHTDKGEYQMAVLTSGYKHNKDASVKFMHIYPNVMVQAYNSKPWLDIYYLLPTGPDTMKLISDWFATKEFLTSASEEEKKQAMEAMFAFEDQAQREDLEVCERQQEGNSSWGYTFGRYVPSMEAAMFGFHKRLSSEYLRYLDSDFE